MADLVKRKVSVIATPGSVVGTLAAKAATTTIPIAFAVPEDPVQLGLVANLGRPGGNATGINTFSQEVTGKRLLLLHDLVPKATRFALLVNPSNSSSMHSTVRELRNGAGAMGVQIQKILNASTISEIDQAFDVLARERVDALFVASDAFFNSRGVQFATLTAREPISAASPIAKSWLTAVSWLRGRSRGHVPPGWRLCRQHPQGREPAELPVLQSVKFKFAINLQTARSSGIDARPRADESDRMSGVLALPNVRLWVKADMCGALPCPLWAISGHSAVRERRSFDHFVRNRKHGGPHVDPKRSCSLKVDGELEFD